ncbi:imidazoleglycerol-phosphate dehydratase HisB [Thermoproteota archaeon]
MKKRTASIKRKTKETDISLTFNLDGSGNSNISTGIPFFDHMLDLFTVHGIFDLDLSVNGDLEVDFHHTVEDIGICLGQAFQQALGSGEQIQRFSSGNLPMDETLCQISIDVSNRPYLDFNAAFEKTKVGEFDVELTEEFLRAFVNHAKITLHMTVLKGQNLHHMIEACFKALGVFLSKAVQIDPRKKGIPSSKGIL